MFHLNTNTCVVSEIQGRGAPVRSNRTEHGRRDRLGLARSSDVASSAPVARLALACVGHGAYYGALFDGVHGCAPWLAPPKEAAWSKTLHPPNR